MFGTYCCKTVDGYGVVFAKVSSFEPRLCSKVEVVGDVEVLRGDVNCDVVRVRNMVRVCTVYRRVSL